MKNATTQQSSMQIDCLEMYKNLNLLSEFHRTFLELPNCEPLMHYPNNLKL